MPEYEMAIASNANFVAAYADLGACKFWMGSIEEVIPLQEQALRLGPRDPLLGGLYWRIGLVHLVKSQYRQAIVSFEKTRTGYVHAYLAAGLCPRGRERARRCRTRRSPQAEPRRSLLEHRSVEGCPTRWAGDRPLFETTYYAGLRKAGMPE